MQLLGRAGNALGVGDGHEITEMPEFHAGAESYLKGMR
jgi:hypothetical protein